MNEVLAVGLQGMQADMARLDQVAMNLANVLTPGYKRGIAAQAALGPSFAAQLGSLESAQLETPAAVPKLEALSDTRAGTLKNTGQPFDVALAGKGYFEVMTPEGLAYTRNGSFHVDGTGRLVTDQGLAVMGVGGEITVRSSHPAIDAAGSIRESSAPDAPVAARLKLVEFDAAAPLVRLGNGLFAPGARMKPVADEDAQVRQGFLENSNVDSAREMTQLIQAMRHFETMQKVVQGYDDMLGNAIRKLSEG